MRPILSAILLAVLAGLAMGQQGVRFDDFFLDKAMRVDLYLVGDAERDETLLALDRLDDHPLDVATSALLGLAALLRPEGYLLFFFVVLFV